MHTLTHTESLRRRYGDHDQPLDAAWNDTLDLLLSHRSVRAYTDEPLPSGALPALIAAAQSAATSSNLQTWSVVAVEQADRKERLSLLAGDQAHIRACPLFLVWLADLSRLERVASQRELPHAALDYTEMFLLAAIDATLAAQNAVVAAESLGLGTVYIGGIRNRPLDVAAELNLPPRVFPVFGLCVGWPDPERPAVPKPRLPQAAVLHHESYHT
ncbi:MAG TPA: NADPH-dependent oxidoreductase, partial [Roseiflexaceae bacterium]|nr:NADPH-dependent oxidoreductase [Roseiflexaceae bacterium]